ncbi:membrane protein [Sinorhizobium fredii USDA 205]|nr:membrane protein [Sinorhizobium fredii USDA 205]
MTNTWIILVLMVLAGLLLSLKVQNSAAPLVLTLGFLMLAVLKARLVVLDFLGLRSGPRVLRVGLIAWPLFFSLAAAAKALIASVSHVG